MLCLGTYFKSQIHKFLCLRYFSVRGNNFFSGFILCGQLIDSNILFSVGKKNENTHKNNTNSSRELRSSISKLITRLKTIIPKSLSLFQRALKKPLMTINHIFLKMKEVVHSRAEQSEKIRKKF